MSYQGLFHIIILVLIQLLLRMPRTAINTPRKATVYRNLDKSAAGGLQATVDLMLNLRPQQNSEIQ